jgi:hypothetical protein
MRIIPLAPSIRRSRLKRPCISNVEYYWWDCYSAFEEAGKLPNWEKYGWSRSNNPYYSKTTGAPRGAGARDALHIAMASIVVWDECRDGTQTTAVQPVNALQWTWSKKSRAWLGPNPLNQHHQKAICKFISLTLADTSACALSLQHLLPAPFCTLRGTTAQSLQRMLIAGIFRASNTVSANPD